MPRLAQALLVAFATLASGCLTGLDAQGLDAASEPAGAFTSTRVHPGVYATDLPFSRPVREATHAAAAWENVRIPSPLDGGDIEIELHRPDTPIPVPVVVLASPYFTHRPDGRFVHLYADPDLPDVFVPHGFAVALVAVRGTADSAGCMDLLGPAERADLDAAITWLGTQSWSNGNVGMMGLSYDGTTSWQVAAAGNPHLKTFITSDGVPDMFSLAYHNGTLWSQGSFSINAQYAIFGFVFSNPENGRSLPHTVDGVACPHTPGSLAAAGESTLTFERDRAGFWAERDLRPLVLENYAGSILLTQGLQDGTVEPSQQWPFVNDLEARGVVVKQLIGQWQHDYPDHAVFGPAPMPAPHVRWDWAETMLHWFSYWLKGDPTADLGAKVQVEDSAGRWRVERDWPPRDAAPLTLHLSGDGTLTAAAPSAGRFPVGAAPDVGQTYVVVNRSMTTPLPGRAPEDPLPCFACATFLLSPSDAELRFAGAPRVHITLTPTGPGGTLAARLLVLDADGRRAVVGSGMMDLRFADGGEKARPVVPGQPLVARMQLEPLDVVVPPGASLVLQISEGSTMERLPGVLAFPVVLEAGAASTLVLDVIARGPDVFFDVPG